jgi:hypothetical protein
MVLPAEGCRSRYFGMLWRIQNNSRGNNQNILRPGNAIEKKNLPLWSNFAIQELRFFQGKMKHSFRIEHICQTKKRETNALP